MTNPLSMLNQLHRPPLLIEAARLGLPDYHREMALRRHLGIMRPPSVAAALLALIEIEAEIDRERRCGGAGYSPARHVDVLIAMMGEARLMRATPLAAVG
ncbi:DUF6477 family protein [Roseovarius amoyensis]|uniref:DUF6477 family protein n=1 Tax=Roseovarius amoyensis TaxID=2211448 RepID=UPI000DBE0CF3|nr:DUF6477 family protein [Roseovarius amoyensis]